MKIYCCKKCGLFLASIRNKNNMHFKAKRGITVKNNKFILKCKCGEVTEIDMNNYIEKDGD